MTSKKINKTKNNVFNKIIISFIDLFKKLLIGFIISFLYMIIGNFIDIAFGFEWRVTSDFIFAIIVLSFSIFRMFRQFNKQDIYYLMGWIIGIYFLSTKNLISTLNVFLFILVPFIFYVIRFLFYLNKDREKN